MLDEPDAVVSVELEPLVPAPDAVPDVLGAESLDVEPAPLVPEPDTVPDARPDALPLGDVVPEPLMLPERGAGAVVVERVVEDDELLAPVSRPVVPSSRSEHAARPKVASAAATAAPILICFIPDS